jgi:hypothetical protein
MCLLILDNNPSRLAKALHTFSPWDLLIPHKRHLFCAKPFRIIPKRSSVMLYYITTTKKNENWIFKRQF